MLKLNYLLEKEVLSKKSKEVLLLLELFGEKQKKTVDQKRLNLSISIDISGSMSSVVKYVAPKMIKKERKVNSPNPLWPNQQPKPWVDPIWLNQVNIGLPNHFPQFPEYDPEFEYVYEQQPMISKLEQAKKVAIAAINKMQDGDIISITAFDDKIYTIASATKLNSSNRMQIIQKINALKCGGSTNLHGGWLASATEVAKNISKESINRVLILTDGQTNHGIVNPNEIIANVTSLYEKNITTTTFGIGEQFNEDLLQGMSNAGNGNFYYVDDDSKLEQMFMEEFSGFSNIIATDVKVNLAQLNIEKYEQLNQYIIKEEVLQIPNISSVSKQTLLLKLYIEIPKNTKVFNVGKIVLNYTDINGNNCVNEVEIKANVVSEKQWEEYPFQEEVKVQETLLVIANNKISATKALDAGDYETAKGLLAGSMAYANSVGFNDHRLLAETQTLNATLSNADQTTVSALRKDLSYQSYKTRFNK